MNYRFVWEQKKIIFVLTTPICTHHYLGAEGGEAGWGPGAWWQAEEQVAMRAVQGQWQVGQQRSFVLY